MMNITKRNALRLWERHFGSAKYAEDFHGNFMCKYGYSNPNYYIWDRGTRVYCGWNIHHVLPLALGGTNAISNLIYTNIITNEIAADPLTFDEFLLNNNKMLYNTIKTAYENKKPLEQQIHEMAIDQVYRYLLVGGMPEAVDSYIENARRFGNIYC